ncbi:MAG: helix-turn-helix domain-containing protein [Prevotella sp.]|nr:helix-turn-helix domain-containing protein [Prevotella sp.]
MDYKNYSHWQRFAAIGKSLLIIALLGFSVQTRAAYGRLYTADKLSSSMIDYVIQDHYGFIWVGTQYGLNRFDGYRFTHFFNEKNDSTTIADNEVSCILVDRKHQLWVGTAKGLCRFDYDRNCFVRYTFPENLRPRVECLLEDVDGNLLVGTSGYGLYAIRAEQDQLTQEAAFSQLGGNDFFTHLFEDAQHNLWRGYQTSTISRIRVSSLHPTANKDYQSPYGPVVSFLPSDKTGFLAVCMYGILRYDYAQGTLTDAGFDMHALDSKVSIRGALIDHKGNIFLGTSGRGLLMIPKGSKTLQQVASDNTRYDLSTANINHIFEDKDHNLWVSCYKKGLFEFNQGKEAFNTWKFAAQNYVLGSSVSSVAEDTDGNIWCTVQKSGIYRFDRNGKISPAVASPAGANCIYRDHQGNFWVGSENTLFAYNPVTGASSPRLTVDGWGINCMADDGEENLYICNYGKGLCVYNTATGQSHTLSMYETDPHKGGLCNDWVKALLMDSRGLLWIATANGVCVMNPADQSFRIFGWDIQLSGIHCFSLCESSEGTILIGTSNGLYQYDRKANKVELFPDSKEIENKPIYTVTRSRDGDLWMSTANGIWQYEAKTRRFISHINGNGLETREYTVGAVVYSADDRISYGSNEGITSFYPNDVKGSPDDLSGKIHLTNFIVEGKSVSCINDHFKVPYNQNSFTLEFSMLNFRNADNITFEYRLNNSNWTPLMEGTNSISFNRMEPGTYTIEVRAMTNGIYSEDTCTVTVVVRAPWYASTWAYLVYALLALAAAAFVFRYLERRHRADLDEQKMQFLINATHDIRSPLTLIMGPLNKLKERITDPESANDIQTIDRNAQRLLLLVNQILDERKIDKNQMHLHCRETNLPKFISGICSLYQYNARQRNINFTFQQLDAEGAATTDELKVWIDRIQFDKVISNLLSNAFKYTFDSGEVSVIVSQEDQEAVVKIEDSGIGFKEENTDRLFERFYQGKNSSDLHIEGTGIGLNLSRAIVQMHGGQVKASNRPDGKRGALLEVRLPLGNDHLKPEEIEDGAAEKQPIFSVQRKQAAKNFRVLVVDDDLEVAQYIKNELGSWYKFDIAPNGREAMKMLLAPFTMLRPDQSDAAGADATANAEAQETPPVYDLVISDVMMPEMDGITMLKQLKSNSNISHIPVILLTSKAEVSDRLEGLKKGADAFLAKPFNMQELHILIDNLIDNHRRLRGKFTGAQRQEDKVKKVMVKGNDDVLMERIMKTINQNLADPDFNVEKLATSVGISRAQLHRKMKEITGISTGEFIRNLRIEQAARLIAEGKINITQVSYSVGFNNQTHFSTVFRRHFGVSPSEYADRAKKK